MLKSWNTQVPNGSPKMMQDETVQVCFQWFQSSSLSYFRVGVKKNCSSRCLIHMHMHIYIERCTYIIFLPPIHLSIWGIQSVARWFFSPNYLTQILGLGGGWKCFKPSKWTQTYCCVTMDATTSTHPLESTVDTWAKEPCIVFMKRQEFTASTPKVDTFLVLYIRHRHRFVTLCCTQTAINIKHWLRKITSPQAFGNLFVARPEIVGFFWNEISRGSWLVVSSLCLKLFTEKLR